MKRPQEHKTTPVGTKKVKHKEALASLPPELREPLTIAILIDDIGRDMTALKDLLAIDAPLSFAVLPYQPHSLEAARTLHSSKRDYLLHLPMEPAAYPAVNPGEGALLTSMTDREIRERFRDDLHGVPYVKGINNHMGSRFTSDAEKMSVVMKEIKERGLFFIDSRTTSDSKARDLAEQLGVPFQSRNIFIDNDQTYEATKKNLSRILDESPRMSGGTLLLIGHPYPSTVAALHDVVPLLRAKGVKIVPVSTIVNR